MCQPILVENGKSYGIYEYDPAKNFVISCPSSPSLIPNLVSKIDTMTTRNINPIIPGFAPDPAIVSVSGWYFLVTSSFHLFPGLPVYASKDLVSWRHIGECQTILASASVFD